MENSNQAMEALKAAQRGMLRSLGVLEAISHLNEEAGLVALIDAGKQLLGITLEDAENAIDASASGGKQ